MTRKAFDALAAGVCGAALAASGALAAPQARKPAPVKPPTVSELVVTAQPKVEPGAVVGDIAPDLQLAPEDVAAYGVSTITELLDELAPEIGSNSGRGGEGPAILLNGKRISGFNEIRNLPTEAILRVDILPEEAALKYGFSPNQRVVNIVLRDRYGSELADLQGGAPVAGGAASGQAEAGITRIHGDRRLNLDLKVSGQESLTEAQRDVTPLTAAPAVDLAGEPVDVRRFRTLVSESRKVSLNAVYAQPLFAGIGATVNGTFEATGSNALRGLPNVRLQAPGAAGPVGIDRLASGFGALAQDAGSWTGHLGLSLNRDLGKWRLALTGNYNHADSRNENDVGVDAAALQAAVLAGAVSPFGALPADLLTLRAQDTGRSRTDSGDVQLVASGPVATIPAGAVRMSLRLGATGAAASSRSERFGLSQSSRFSQGGGNVQASLDAPLTSRRNEVAPIFGDLTANAHLGLQQVSGFGTLTTVGYGLHWSPFTGLSILLSHQRDQAAPSQAQLNAPILFTPGSRIFDFATGQTVDVVQVSGGNPDLSADKRDRSSLRITWKPFADRQLILRADFNKIRYRNPIATFPAPSAQIEATFPDRFVRDADGALTEVDDRPVNFASQDVSSLKWGFDFSRPIGPATAPAQRAGAFGQVRRALPRGGFDGPGGRPRGGRGGRAGGQDGRLRIAVFHTVYFENNFLVRPGGPRLDFLDGASLGGAGGQPRQEVQAQVNLAERGYGAELNADWKSGTTVRGGAAGDLAFSGLVKVDARLFADLSQRKTLVEKAPWLNGARVTLSVSNLFGQRMQVHDAAGVTPLSFQPAYLDPLGRTWRIEFRKLFS